MTKIIPLFVCLFFNTNIFSQKQGQALMDSLIAELPKITNDTSKARLLNKVSLYYAEVNIDSAIKYTSLGMLLATKMNWRKGISAFYTCYGNIYVNKGMYDTALFYHNKALQIAIEINDTNSLSVKYNNLGTTANAKSDFVTATAYYTKSLELAEAKKNYYNIGIAYGNLALVYQHQKDFIKALNYAKKSVENYTIINDIESSTYPLKLIGDIFVNLKNYDSAIIYFQLSLSKAKQSNNKLREAEILGAIADYYAKTNKINIAINYALQAKEIWNNFDNNYEEAIGNIGSLGSYYLQIAQQQNNKQYITKAIAYLSNTINKFKEKQNKAKQAQFQEDLAIAYELIGNYKEAYINYVQFKQIEDSIFSQENKNKIAAFENQVEMDKKNKEIEKQKVLVKEQRKNILLLFLGTITFLVIGLLYFRLSKVRKQKNFQLVQLNQQLDNANKTKAKFFAILTHDLRGPVSNLVNFLHLQQSKDVQLTDAQKAEQELKISKSATNLLDTMEGILLWSKGQMENFTPEKKEIPVANIFSYLQLFFTSVDYIKFTFINNENIMVNTDENYLKTILINITQNAINALAKVPNAKIIFKTWNEEESINISVTDNGPGMSKEQIQRFNENSTIASSKNGLGLYIIKDLAEKINCTIQLTSNLTQGTTIILSIKN